MRLLAGAGLLQSSMNTGTVHLQALLDGPGQVASRGGWSSSAGARVDLDATAVSMRYIHTKASPTVLPTVTGRGCRSDRFSPRSCTMRGHRRGRAALEVVVRGPAEERQGLWLTGRRPLLRGDRGAEAAVGGMTQFRSGEDMWMALLSRTGGVRRIVGRGQDGAIPIQLDERRSRDLVEGIERVEQEVFVPGSWPKCVLLRSNQP
jgi:hypothetical protein